MFAARRHPAKSITLDLRPQYNTIDVEHDFLGGTTEDLSLRFNGEQVFWLFYNPNNTKHYSMVGVNETVSGIFEFTDENGDSRVSQSVTSLTTPATPVGSRQRWCSPDVLPGNGDLTNISDPGSLQDAADTEISGDRINLAEGTKPYSVNDLTFSATNVTLIAKPGETPIISGASTATVSWRDDTGINPGIYSLDAADFDANTKQVHALINSVMERQAEKATFAELVSADHGWIIDGGRLHIKLSSSITSFVTIDPSTVTVVLPKNNTIQIFASADGFWCEDVVVEFVGAGSGSSFRGIRASADNVVLRNVTFRHIFSQGAFIGSTDNFLVENCTCEDNNEYITWDGMKSGNTEVSSKIHLSGATNGTVRNCTFNGSPDCLATKDTSGVCRNINIYGNLVVKCKDDGIDINSECIQIKRWNNEIDRTFRLASFAPNTIGPIWIINDKCYGGGYMSPEDVVDPTAPFTNQIFKFGGTPVGPIGLFICLGNTFESIENAASDYNNAYGWSMLAADASTRSYLRNNIVVTRGKPFRDLTTELDNVYDIDYNLYWNPAGDEYGYGNLLFQWRDGVTSGNFVGFQSDSGQEINGEFSNPDLDGNKIPTTPIPGQRIPGITGNAIFGSLEAVKGAQ